MCRQPTKAGVAQLRQLDQGIACIASANVRKGLGEVVDFALGHTQCATDVADRVAYAIGVHHRHARDALVAEPFEDRGVDLEPSC